MATILYPLFDNMQYIHQNHNTVILPDEKYRQEFLYALHFLKAYTGSQGTFNSYRREIERFLQWTWLYCKKDLTQLKRADIEAYIHFCQYPPAGLIGPHKVPRFIVKEGLRIPNAKWRPFIQHISKAARKSGDMPSIDDATLSPGAISEIFAILSTFFNFLIAEEYLFSNPVMLIRQKSKFIRKQQQAAPVRRLSDIQWQMVYQSAEALAIQEPHKHERTLFIVSLLFGMYLRISEVVASERFTPCMNHFMKDANGAWWFKTVGKGNKERHIAVSDAMLNSLIRWREFLGLAPLPGVSDTSPLIPKLRGQGPMSDTAPIRRLVQLCFDEAEARLRAINQADEADLLRAATAHWLRHTGISEDIKKRPRDHVREDAGHTSGVTTDRYIHIEKQARYDSARNKTIALIPDE